MADARIVYEGATGGGGNLFAGKVFFLSQRIPFRNTYKKYVESNGGTITQIEKQADMLIADHARKDPPVGSISWKWIEDSVKHGRLEDIEDYRAGPAEPQIREVGSGQPTRKGRVKFTAEDDKILMEWCTRAERQGQSLGGNKIYDQLALKHPRHTSQSWRDHWRTQLAHLKRPELPDDEDNNEEEEAEEGDPIPVPPQPRQPQNRHSDPQRTSSPIPPPVRRTQSAISPSLPVQRVVASPVRSETSRASPLLRSFEANPYILKSAGGNVFTNEETQLLFDTYDSIMDISDDQILDAWIAWSIAHPNHTPQEWRNYFTEYIVPTIMAKIEPKKKRQVKEIPPMEIDLEEETTKPSSSKPKTGKPTEIKDSQSSSGQTILSPVTKKVVDPCLIDMKEFENSLLLVADSLDLEVNFKPVICGRTLPLFNLWQVVQADEFGGYDAVTGRRQWQKVATKLNFHPFRDTNAASDLRACYSEILADFEDVRRDFLERGGISESQEEELINDQLLQTVRQTESTNSQEQDVKESSHKYDELLNELEKQEDELQREYEEHDDDLNSAQISPHRPRFPSPSAGKRKIGVDRRNQDIPYSKRQRIDKAKGREIPSTPEDVINSNQTTWPSHQPSPLKFAAPPSDSDDSPLRGIQPIMFSRARPAVRKPEPPSDSDDSPLRGIQPMKLSRARPAVRKPVPILEPETQDFHYSQSPQYPPSPKQNIDDDNNDTLFIPQYQPTVQDLDEDEDEDEDIVLIRQSSPPAPKRSPERRNISTNTTQGSLHSSSNSYESSTQSQTESQAHAELFAFINKQVSEGYPQEIVLKALETTSMASEKEALAVLDSLLEEDGIPENIPGVWTELDNEALKMGKATAEYQRLIRKHGVGRIRVRERYLADMKMAEEEVGDE